jgi:uncharacterized protein
MENITCVTPSWIEMVEYSRQTTSLIKKSGFKPDIIIALSRGGLVPARIFCDFLHIKNCYSIKIDHWGLTATKDGKARINHGLDMDLSGKNVLIVDDITDTGESLELAKTHIENLDPMSLKTATLIHLSNSKYTPDYFGIQREWAWIIFPWNYQEDLVNLTKKMLAENKDLSVDQIHTNFKEMHSINVSANDVENTLQQIKYIDS